MGSSHTKQKQLIKKKKKLREPNTKATQKDNIIIIIKKKKKTANRQRQVITVKRFTDPKKPNSMLKMKNRRLTETDIHTHARMRADTPTHTQVKAAGQPWLVNVQ